MLLATGWSHRTGKRQVFWTCLRESEEELSGGNCDTIGNVIADTHRISTKQQRHLDSLKTESKEHAIEVPTGQSFKCFTFPHVVQLHHHWLQGNVAEIHSGSDDARERGILSVCSIHYRDFLPQVQAILRSVFQCELFGPFQVFTDRSPQCLPTEELPASFGLNTKRKWKISTVFRHAWTVSTGLGLTEAL